MSKRLGGLLLPWAVRWVDHFHLAPGLDGRPRSEWQSTPEAWGHSELDQGERGGLGREVIDHPWSLKGRV